MIAGGADVVHATTWAIPATRGPLVVTVHDLAFLHEPSHFTARGNRYFRRALDQTRRSATSIIVPSRSTADDCVAAGLPAALVGRSLRIPGTSPAAVRHALGPLPARLYEAPATLEERFLELTRTRPDADGAAA